MNDIQIKCFLEAAMLENFTRAAGKLYMAQPVLSRNIAMLEQEMGVQLFLRERKSVRLSNAGKICFEGFQKLCSDYNDIRNRALSAQRAFTGGLLIGTAEGQLVGEAYSSAFNILLSDYPGINIKLSFYSLSELKKMLMTGGLDIALIAKSEITDILDCVEFTEIRSCESRLVVPASHPLSDKHDLTFADFNNEVFLTLDINESKTILNYNAITGRCGRELKFRVAPDIGTLALWLESGMGVATLNNWHSLKNSPKLKFIRIPGVSSVTEVAAWRCDNSNPAVPMFLNAVDRAKPE